MRLDWFDQHPWVHMGLLIAWLAFCVTLTVFSAWMIWGGAK